MATQEATMLMALIKKIAKYTSLGHTPMIITVASDGSGTLGCSCEKGADTRTIFSPDEYSEHMAEYFAVDMDTWLFGKREDIDSRYGVLQTLKANAREPKKGPRRIKKSPDSA